MVQHNKGRCFIFCIKLFMHLCFQYALLKTCELLAIRKLTKFNFNKYKVILHSPQHYTQGLSWKDLFISYFHNSVAIK